MNDLGQRELEQALDELRKEGDMESAYIAGVGKGIELMKKDIDLDRRDFERDLRKSFRNWLEQFKQQMSR